MYHSLNFLFSIKKESRRYSVKTLSVRIWVPDRIGHPLAIMAHPKAT